MLAFVSFALTYIALTSQAQAAAKAAPIFSTHMVLQQGIPVPVWGTADPGEKVTVSIAGKNAEATADGQGKWSLKVEPLAASDQPLEMKISSTNSELVISDVLVGEVWICSGQSNMVASKRDLISADVGSRKRIRFFKIANEANIVPQDSAPGTWVVCTPEANKLNFSATGYFFAVDIEKARNVPVGMIQSAWSGTPILPWIDLATVEASPNFKKDVAAVTSMRARLPEALEDYTKKTLPEYELKLQQWKDQRQASTSNGVPNTPKGKAAESPKKPEAPGKQHGLASAIHNAMIHPLIPYAIRGVIWYQGESNAGSADTGRAYAELLPMLIKSWRTKWGQGDFPFIFVQLPAYTRGSAWPYLRQAQLETLSVPASGMGVALDLNPQDDLHPPDKSAVGQRLALVALRIAYQQDLVAYGPLYKSCKAEKEKIRITFTEVGSGLTIGQPPLAYRRKPVAAAPIAASPADSGAAGNSTNAPPASAKPAPHPADIIPLDKLVGFEVAAADGKFFPATAQIEDNAVVAWSESVPEPTQVRYAWAAYPQYNLYNKEGLPASPFSSADCDAAKAR
ncbi:MAG TPA: sialate O-acetylesterase [Candidatus Methylacidiphilales bacterium]|nr:sialate O-acetylesterase [Candidatus Methylacidiphilales bacterium]